MTHLSYLSDRLRALAADLWARTGPAQATPMSSVRTGLLVVTAAALVVAATLPALSTLRNSSAQLSRLERELQQMQRLASQARYLQTLPVKDRQQTPQRLTEALQSLGQSAHLSLAEGRANVRLSHADPEALAAWLLQARTQAGAVVTQASLQRTDIDGRPAWTGELVLLW